MGIFDAQLFEVVLKPAGSGKILVKLSGIESVIGIQDPDCQEAIREWEDTS
jgi:hypothetical protein